jgi:hypothetical protein
VNTANKYRFLKKGEVLYCLNNLELVIKDSTPCSYFSKYIGLNEIHKCNVPSCLNSRIGDVCIRITP